MSTKDSLTILLTEWCQEQGLEAKTATDLLKNKNLTHDQSQWLGLYGKLWSRTPGKGGIQDTMYHEGYETYNTGGGCMAWIKHLLDESYILISYDSGLYGPLVGDWYCSRNGKHEGWISVECKSLTDALHNARLIPNPVVTTYREANYESMAKALDDIT